MSDKLSHRLALEMICASVGRDGHPNGHWHGVAVKIARHALVGTDLNLSQKDLDTIGSALPSPSSPTSPLKQIGETE